MTITRDYVGFYLNGEFTKIFGRDVYLTLADYLRKERDLTGTKVVCAEGDCGACTVLVARVQESIKQQSTSLIYKTANSCIQFLGLLDGAHVVTVEGIQDPITQQLHPIQANMVACHGAQCGYCTPGFICSLTGLVEDVSRENQKIDQGKIKNHLTGNLCRCTGYEPIIDSALGLDIDSIPLLKNHYPNEEEIIRTLKKLIEVTVCIKFSDKNLQDEIITKEFFMPSSLMEALTYKSSNPQARLVSGATDLGVLANKGRVHLVQKMSLNNILSMYDVSNNSESIALGAKVNLTQAEKSLHLDFNAFSELLHIFASPQIKNQGTLVGNIVNASPIGDTIPFLNVSDARLVLASDRDGNASTREIKVDDFILGYKKLNMNEDEIVTKIILPKTECNFKLYKASLRRDLDISQVTFAARYDIAFDQTASKYIVKDLQIAFGGMSEKVQRVSSVVDILRSDFDQPSIEKAKLVLEKTFLPFSDVRASRDYRISVAKNFLQKFYDEVTQSYVHINSKMITNSHGKIYG